MIVYKVTRHNGKSARIEGDVAVEYKIGQTTRPKLRNTPLFAFKSLQDALEFVSGNDIIFECKATPSKIKIHHIKNVWSSLDAASTNRIKRFWRNVINKKLMLCCCAFYYAAPRGSVACASITPKKRIYPRNIIEAK